MKQGNWVELENVAAPYDADYRSSGFEPDDVRPTPEAAKPQLRRMQDEAPRIRFPGEPHWLLWKSEEQRERAIKAAEAYEYREYQAQQQQIQRERQEKEARRRRAQEQRAQWREDHWEILKQQMHNIAKDEEIDYEGTDTDDTGYRRERESREIQAQREATGFFKALRIPAPAKRKWTKPPRKC
eukprot:COSAG05_NODE_121_length_17719_cov_168.686266_4_plen_184_part_00